MMKLSADALDAKTFRKSGVRRVFRKSGTDTAAKIIGALKNGDEICGVTNGQFSLIDIIEHVLHQTGSANVSVATWTMGIYDTERSWEFVKNKLLKSIRFVLDPSMFSRRPEIAAILLQGFGVESFRAVNSHAKFATVRGDDLAVCIRSSMNLNPNNRIESFDISVCDDTTRFFENIVDEIWQKIDIDNRSQSATIFAELLETEAVPSHRRPNPFLFAG